jgi:hypothetical protein
MPLWPPGRLYGLFNLSQWVWKCPICGNVKDARETYKAEAFLAVMAERIEIKEGIHVN